MTNSLSMTGERLGGAAAMGIAQDQAEWAGDLILVKVAARRWRDIGTTNRRPK